MSDHHDSNKAPILQVREIGKTYGSILALRGVSAEVYPGKVLCVLGDNGAGKSTLIKILAGAHPHTEGTLWVDGREHRFVSPREALERGIATVYQDLASLPLMPVWRNFFAGAELTRGRGPFRRLDVRTMRDITRNELAKIGIHLPDINQPIGMLSGGERQSVFIARAIHFGARLIILDEPTAALGVRQAGVVLKYIAKARKQGLGIVFITHNPQHAYLVGDQFLLLKLGKSIGYFQRKDTTIEQITHLMAGGSELEELSDEIREISCSTPDRNSMADEPSSQSPAPMP